jgi:tRNA U34 5-methylaminomethyl-2-thiouridine-forming methyltransferase MnmC
MLPVTLTSKSCLSKSSDAQVQFSTQLKALELKFDADWEPLKKLNASFELDGKSSHGLWQGELKKMLKQLSTIFKLCCGWVSKVSKKLLSSLCGH